MIDPDRLRARDFPPAAQTCSARDTILYAPGLGIGGDAAAPAALRATRENAPGFAPPPSMAAALGSPGFRAMAPDTGISWRRLLHGEQAVTLHAPPPTAGTVLGRTRVTGIIGKGRGKGAAPPAAGRSDPAAARQAGFDRPILHGPCTFGVAGRSIAQTMAGGAPDRIASLPARFSAPVHPGETLRTETWAEGDAIAFRPRPHPQHRGAAPRPRRLIQGARA